MLKDKLQKLKINIAVTNENAKQFKNIVLNCSQENILRQAAKAFIANHDKIRQGFDVNRGDKNVLNKLFRYELIKAEYGCSFKEYNTLSCKITNFGIEYILWLDQGNRPDCKNSKMRSHQAEDDKSRIVPKFGGENELNTRYIAKIIYNNYYSSDSQDYYLK